MSAFDNHDEIENWVVEVCKGLGLPVTGTDSDFFEAGGTSLTAMRLIGKAEETYGEDALPPTTCTPRAACVTSRRRSGATVPSRARSARAKRHGAA